MTTPIDTTRLRADAEAVRDAGAKLVAVEVEWPRMPYQDYLNASLAANQALRDAKATLYANAPPDAIILALLDEVERLRALVAPPVEPEHAEDAREWCWRRPGEEVCQGPYATREEAIREARHGHLQGGPIEVGRCTPPMDALGTPTADDMRERVNDSLCDEGLDAHAIILDEPAANAALREWFLRYVEVDGMQWIARDEETVWPDEPEEGGTP